MEKHLISVIVPIYNVEDYLDECVISIINQSYNNLEIILVDDGSTDGSGQLCDAWADKDERIKVIHKANGGLSDARNAGMEIATGDMIGFVDSDDYISEDMYYRMINAIEQSGSTVALCSVTSETDEINHEIQVGADCEFFSGRDLVNKTVFKEVPDLSYSVWKYIFKRDVISDACFPVGKYYEDVLFIINAIWYLDKVAYLKDKLYYYRLRQDSITGVKISSKHVDDMLTYVAGVLEFYKNNGTELENKRAKGAMLKDLLAYKWLCHMDSSMAEEEGKILSFIKERNLSIRFLDTSFIDRLRYIRYRYF